MTSYESILAKLSNLQPSSSPDERVVEWLTPASVVGLSRAAGGEIEVFLAGPKLVATSRTVRRALDYRTWHRSGTYPPVNANRLVLPAVGHFDQVAAFLCIELIRANSDGDLVKAFRKTEPIIELAISRLRMTDRALLGLTGELLLLDAILRQVRSEQVSEVLESWRGWRESTRDFSWNSVGVEVKTTTRPDSSHQVQGVRQLELTDQLESGFAEQKLLLVSMGLEFVSIDHDNARTLPRLADSLVARLVEGIGPSASAPAVESFLDHVRDYGDERNAGYDHRTMSHSPAFARPFVCRFVRCYDMADPNVEVLRSENLIPFRHVDASSVKFRIELPAHIRGDLNPIAGLNLTAKEIISASYGA